MSEPAPHGAFDSRRLWEVPWQAARNFVKDDCTTLAAAIAFYSLLSLAPALYLVGFTLSSVFVNENASRRAVEIVADFLPPEAVPTVESVQQTLEVRGALLLVALPGLFWIASHVLHAIQSALNVVFARKPRGRQIWSARMKSLIGLVAGAAFLGGVLLLGAGLEVLDRFSSMLGLPEMPTGLSRMVSALVTPFLTLLVFHLLYRLLPYGRCGRWPAASGALVAMATWQVARTLFGMVLSHSPGFGLVTGTLAGVLAFLLWIYTGVLLILFGAEVAAVLNGDRPA